MTLNFLSSVHNVPSNTRASIMISLIQKKTFTQILCVKWAYRRFHVLPELFAMHWYMYFHHNFTVECDECKWPSLWHKDFTCTVPNSSLQFLVLFFYLMMIGTQRVYLGLCGPVYDKWRLYTNSAKLFTTSLIALHLYMSISNRDLKTWKYGC